MIGVDVNVIATDLGQILAGCRNGVRSAQQELYERFHRKVYGLAARLAGRREADDLTQEIFLRLFAGIANFRGTAGFSTWLYRVAVNDLKRQTDGSYRIHTDIFN